MLQYSSTDFSMQNMGPRLKNYECSFCGKEFDRMSYVLRHEKTHTGDKPFICEFCGKGFSQKSNCKIHLFRCPFNTQLKPKFS